MGNAVDKVMSECIKWGGPIVTRADAVRDLQSQGASHKEIDAHVFSRSAVPCPDNLAEHQAMLKRITGHEHD